MKVPRLFTFFWKPLVISFILILVILFLIYVSSYKEPFSIEVGMPDTKSTDPTIPFSIISKGGTAKFTAKKNGDNGFQIYNNNGQTLSWNMTPGVNGQPATVQFRNSNNKLVQGTADVQMDQTNKKIGITIDDNIIGEFVSDPIFTNPVFAMGVPQAGSIPTWSSLFSTSTDQSATNSSTYSTLWNSTYSLGTDSSRNIIDSKT